MKTVEFLPRDFKLLAEIHGAMVDGNLPIDSAFEIWESASRTFTLEKFAEMAELLLESGRLAPYWLNNCLCCAHRDTCIFQAVNRRSGKVIYCNEYQFGGQGL